MIKKMGMVFGIRCRMEMRACIKGSGNKDFKKVMGLKSILGIALITVVSIGRTWSVEVVSWNFRRTILIKVIFKMINLMDMEPINGVLSNNIRVIGIRIKWLGRVQWVGKMVKNTAVNSWTINDMDLVNSIGQTDPIFKVNGRIIFSMGMVVWDKSLIKRIKLQKNR